MARTAFVLGGTGQIGRALVARLIERGWEVDVASRGERPLPGELASRARPVTLDRCDTDALRAALGDGVDALVDVVAFRGEDAEQLLSLRGLVGSLIVISSASVYADERGHSLDEATSPETFPELPVPIPERQRTVEPGEETYSTRKVAVERALLGQDAVPATIVRPGAIHGPGSALPREWHFVKRALDRRRAVLLAHRGESLFHTTSSRNLAELILLAAERPGTRVLNCGDPNPPTVLAIARAIASALEHEWVEVLIAGPSPGKEVGETPWTTPKPFVLDMSAAEAELGYRPVVTYEEAVRETSAWLVSVTEGRPWQDVLPQAAKHMAELFDYEAEDDFLAGLRGATAG